MTEARSIGFEKTPREPGFLLQPFQWAAKPLMRLALIEPRLLAHLTDLDVRRLHVIAFFLAHRQRDADDRTDAALLACSPARVIISRATGGSPGQLLGLFRRLPNRAMRVSTYKRLAVLVSDKILVNAMMKQPELDSLTISRLAAVPPALCSASLRRAVGGDLEKLLMVSEIAAWFRRRWNIEAATSFSTAHNFEDLRQQTADLLRALPPVPRLPPRLVGSARLIETPSELRQAGRIGRNCLSLYAREMGLSRVGIYIWEDGGEPIYIKVDNANGLGWFLADMKEAGNRTPPDERRILVDRAFDEAGIDWGNVADNLRCLLSGNNADR